MMARGHTAVVERNRTWKGRYETEPYEAGWAREAVFFVRVLELEGPPPVAPAQVQISPDGTHWCDEGTAFILTDQEVDFCKVAHFGNWLRLAGELPEGARIKVIVALCLKE